MLKRVAVIPVILVLPFLGVACGEEATPTPTPSSTATPTPSPSGVLGEEPPEGWVVYQNEEHGFLFSYPEGWEQYSPEGISEEVEFFTGFRDSTLDDFQEITRGWPGEALFFQLPDAVLGRHGAK